MIFDLSKKLNKKPIVLERNDKIEAIIPSGGIYKFELYKFVYGNYSPNGKYKEEFIFYCPENKDAGYIKIIARGNIKDKDFGETSLYWADVNDKTFRNYLKYQFSGELMEKKNILTKKRLFEEIYNSSTGEKLCKDVPVAVAYNGDETEAIMIWTEPKTFVEFGVKTLAYHWNSEEKDYETSDEEMEAEIEAITETEGLEYADSRDFVGQNAYIPNIAILTGVSDLCDFIAEEEAEANGGVGISALTPIPKLYEATISDNIITIPLFKPLLNISGYDVAENINKLSDDISYKQYRVSDIFELLPVSKGDKELKFKINEERLNVTWEEYKDYMEK